MKKILVLALTLLAAVTCFCGCSSMPQLFEKTVYESYEGNRVFGASVAKEGDLFYRYVNGKKTGNGYLSLTSANSVYTVYAYLENPDIVIFDLYLGQKQNGAWILLSGGEEFLLPSGGEWSFVMPYLAGKQTRTVTAADGTETEETLYSLISLYDLDSDLSQVQNGAIVSPYLVVSGTSDFDGDEVLDGVVLDGEDGISRVYDGSGKLLFEKEQRIQYCKKNGEIFYKTYDTQSATYSLYDAERELLLSGATYLQDSADLDYFIATYKGEDGVLSYVVSYGENSLTLASSDALVAATSSYIVYAQKQSGGKYAYYRYNGKDSLLLPYEVVSVSSYGDAYIAWKTETSTTVDILDGDLNPVFTDLPEDVQISPLSDPQNGILCLYSQSEADQAGFPTARFLTPNGPRTVCLFGGNAIGSTDLAGYYKVMAQKPNGAYETHVYNVFTDTCSRSFDALSLRYENGIQYVIGISYADNAAFVLDGASFETVYAFSLQNAEKAVFETCYTEEFLIAQTAEQNAMPLTVFSLTEGETTSYYALYRAAAYGENFASAPMKITQIAGEPQFSAAQNLLVVGTEVGTVYRVEPEGLVHVFQADRTLTGAFTVGSRSYYLYEESGKTGVVNALNEVVISAAFDEVVAQERNALSLRQGEFYALAVLSEDGKVSYPAGLGLSSVELYADGFAVAVDGNGVATLYRNGEVAKEEPLVSCDLYYDVQKTDRGALTVRRLYSFIYGDGTYLSCGEEMQPSYQPVCSIGSFGDDMPDPVYYLTYVSEGQTLQTDRVEPTHLNYVLSAPAREGCVAYFFFDEACTQPATRAKVFSGEYGTEITIYVFYQTAEE